MFPSSWYTGALIEDTRQKPHAHIIKNDWWNHHGVMVTRQKLDFGDYVSEDNSVKIAIDTKQDLMELAQDLGRENRRFCRECDRAYEAGYRLIILVEERPPAWQLPSEWVNDWTNERCQQCKYWYESNYDEWSHLDPEYNGWENDCDPESIKSTECLKYKYRPMLGKTLARSITTVQNHHHCEFKFCDKSETAQIICDLLGITYY